MHLLNATYQEIQNKIKENSETREKEKNTFAEVFTPLELIEDMLNHFPPSVWKNPNNKWLDPSAGRGNFFLVVYFRLMQSLKNTIQDKNKRHKHILSKMLYMVELNTDNYHTLLFLFGKNTNIINDDFLNDTHSLNKEKFHIIVSNPPYQKNKQHTYAGSSGNKTLWDKFLLKSLNTLLSPNGFLGMITPSNWRRPEHPLLDIISKQNQLLYLHIFNKKQGLEIFKAQTRFDVYCIQKTPIYKKTTIIDETNKTHIVCLKKTPFIPNGDFHAIHKITTIETKNGTPILYNSSLYSSKKLKKQKTKKYKHPIIHTMTKKGLGVRYSKVPFFKEPKVILNFNETFILEFMGCIMVVYLIRDVIINLTILPKHMNCSIKKEQMTNYEYFVGGCYDKIFSGHFSLTMMLTLMYYTYGYITNIPLLVGWNLINGLIIISTRSHYTIDVVMAMFVCLTVFTNDIKIPFNKIIN